MTLALLAERTKDRHDADFTVVAQHHRRLVTITIHLLQLEEVPRDSLAVLHVVATPAPTELLRGGVGTTL